METFTEWLLEEMGRKNMSQQALAQKSGITPAQVSRIISGQRGLGEKSLKAIAHALNISPVTIFRKAGLLPEGGEQASIEDWKHLLDQLTPSQWVRGKGQHVALWDEQTYFAILAEQDRRHSLRARAKYYALTGVLKCSICGTSVHRHGKQGTNFIYMNCSSPKTHIITRYDKLLPLVADAVIQAIQTYKNDPAVIDSTEHITEKIHTQQTLRQRVQEGYEVGLYNQLEAQKKIVAAENEIERLTRARDRAAQQHRQKQAMLQFAEQDLNRMRAWIIEDDPATVNVFLTSLCENMIISPENQIIVIFRT